MTYPQVRTLNRPMRNYQLEMDKDNADTDSPKTYYNNNTADCYIYSEGNNLMFYDVTVGVEKSLNDLSTAGGGAEWTDMGAFLKPNTDGQNARVYDAGGADYLELLHDGTNPTIKGINGDIIIDSYNAGSTSTIYLKNTGPAQVADVDIEHDLTISSNSHPVLITEAGIKTTEDMRLDPYKAAGNTVVEIKNTASNAYNATLKLFSDDNTATCQLHYNKLELMDGAATETDYSAGVLEYFSTAAAPFQIRSKAGSSAAFGLAWYTQNLAGAAYVNRLGITGNVDTAIVKIKNSTFDLDNNTVNDVGTLNFYGSTQRFNYPDGVFSNADATIHFADDASLLWDESDGQFIFDRPVGMHHANNPTTRYIHMYHSDVDAFLLSKYGNLYISNFSTTANTTVYIKNIDATYKSNLKIENDVQIEGNLLTFNYGGGNADCQITFASDASLLWDENEDRFVLDKHLSIGADNTYFGKLYLYGHATGSTTGGRIHLYTAADHDTVIDYWRIYAFQDDLRIIPAVGNCAFAIKNDGKIGINDTTPAHQLDVNGDIGMIGSVANTDRTVHFASDASLMWDESGGNFVFDRTIGMEHASNPTTRHIYMFHNNADGFLSSAYGTLYLTNFSTTANTTVYVKNIDATYKANLKVENDLQLEGDLLTFNHGGGDANCQITVASNASLQWDESSHTFEFTFPSTGYVAGTPMLLTYGVLHQSADEWTRMTGNIPCSLSAGYCMVRAGKVRGISATFEVSNKTVNGNYDIDILIDGVYKDSATFSITSNGVKSLTDFTFSESFSTGGVISIDTDYVGGLACDIDDCSIVVEVEFT